MFRRLAIAIRLAALMGIIVSGIFLSILCSVFLRNSIRRRRLQTRIYCRFSPWILAMVKAGVQTIGSAVRAQGKPFFFIANHLSDMDVIALMALHPVVFITSIEVRETPFVGTLATYGGSAFVERRHRSRLRDELRELEALFRAGFDIVLFAEGTSSNGEQVLPFHNAFFAPAINAEAILQPVCLQYRRIGGQPTTRQNRDRVFYYGDMEFFSHMWQLCAAGGFDLECRYLTPVILSRTDSRKEICDKVFQEIAAAYTPVPE